MVNSDLDRVHDVSFEDYIRCASCGFVTSRLYWLGEERPKDGGLCAECMMQTIVGTNGCIVTDPKYLNPVSAEEAAEENRKHMACGAEPFGGID